MRARWRNVVFGLLLAATGISGAIASAPALASGVRRAWELRELPVWRRREALFGPYYASVRTIRARIPQRERVAIVLADETDLVNGIFAGTYLYPRESILYRSFGDWETHRLEGAVRDRPRPSILVWLNDDVTPEARVMTPEAIRRELAAR